MKKVRNFFHNYIHHIRAQPKDAQRLHAFSISGIVTVIIAVLWLHFHYGFWSGGEYVRDDTVYETQNLTDYDGRSPALVIRGFFSEAKTELSKIWGGVGGFFTSSSTFEREE